MENLDAVGFKFRIEEEAIREFKKRVSEADKDDLEVEEC